MIRKINNNGKINLLKGCGFDLCDTDNTDCGSGQIDICGTDNCSDCNDEPIKCPRLDIVH